jgi:alkylation response protein AidB-like acyl-CoA dehydrogenase
MRFYSILHIARFTSLRAAAAIDAGRLPGLEVSLGKLASVRMMRTRRDLALRVLGPNGQIVGEDAPLGGRVAQIALSVPGMSITGGTDEIQHNIVAERVLGLPREPRPN